MQAFQTFIAERAANAAIPASSSLSAGAIVGFVAASLVGLLGCLLLLGRYTHRRMKRDGKQVRCWSVRAVIIATGTLAIAPRRVAVSFSDSSIGFISALTEFAPCCSNSLALKRYQAPNCITVHVLRVHVLRVHENFYHGPL